MRGLFSRVNNLVLSDFKICSLRPFLSVYLLSFFIVSCKQKPNEDELFSNLKENKLDLSKEYWNLVVEPQDIPLAAYKHHTLLIDRSVLYFGPDFGAKILLVDNTFIVSDTLPIDEINLSNNRDKYTKIETDSTGFSKAITIFFEGKILKATNDSLVIKKINGTGFFCEQKEFYRFYNDRILYDPEIELDTIEFSSTTCFGSCPAFAIKIDKGLNFYFWGGEFANKEGFYQGKIKKSFFNKLQNMVRIARIKQFNGELGILVDGSYQDIIFDYNQTKSNFASGDLGSFPPRLKNICRTILELYDSLPEIMPTNQVHFEAFLDTPENRDKLRNELVLR